MKTIAISIDERTLEAIDRLAGAARGADRARVNRSRVVRLALQEYVARRQRHELEARDRRAYAKHRGLAKELEALVAEQAKP